MRGDIAVAARGGVALAGGGWGWGRRRHRIGGWMERMEAKSWAPERERRRAEAWRRAAGVFAREGDFAGFGSEGDGRFGA